MAPEIAGGHGDETVGDVLLQLLAPRLVDEVAPDVTLTLPTPSSLTQLCTLVRPWGRCRCHSRPAGHARVW